MLSVVITDNGPGVPEALRSRIFEPFFTPRPMGVGIGVGLSLSHGIIAAHGGTIVLENPPEGGARFVVTIPWMTTEAPPDMSAPESGTQEASYTILIVDDEPEIADMLSDILRYAHSAIPEVWVVDLTSASLHVYRTPSSTGYEEVTHVRRGATLAPQAFPDLIPPVQYIVH